MVSEDRIRSRRIVIYMGVILICTFILSIATVKNSSRAKDICDNTRTGYIYTGDSRIRRLNLTINMSKKKDNWVYCKSGMGYNWFVGDSLKKIKTTMKEHSEIDQWVIVSAWGVNDLWNLNTYISQYKKLLYGDWKKCKLYLVSVNPVDRGLTRRYSSISSFNNKIKQFVNDNTERSKGRIFYIDTNKKLTTDGFSTIDGLHYTEKTNMVIYDTIRAELDRSNAHINYSMVDMNPASVRTITVKDINSKVVWTVADKSIVRITEKSGAYNQKATIVAKKTGSTEIIARSGELEFRCSINVTDKKVLVAYYSYSGNAEMVAEYVRDYAGGNLVEIDPVNIYPLNENKLMTYAKKELDSNARPVISNEKLNLCDYNEVYVGFPVWYGHAPRPVCSFLDKCSLNGATINIFCTCEEGDAGESIIELQNLYKTCTIKEGVTIQDDMVLNNTAKTSIREWLDRSAGY